jgi:2'-5' RNA ligase
VANQWFLWEKEDERPKREAADFGRLAETITQKADAELLSRNGQGILGNLYGAAEKGLSFLDEQRQTGMDAAQQFGQYAQERLAEAPERVGGAVSRAWEQSQETPGLLQAAGADTLESANRTGTPLDAVSDTMRRSRNVGFNAVMGDLPANTINRVADEYGVNPKVNVPVLGEMGAGDVASMALPGVGVMTTEKYGANAAERGIQRGIEAGKDALPKVAGAASDAVRKTLDAMGIGKQANNVVETAGNAEQVPTVSHLGNTGQTYDFGSSQFNLPDDVGQKVQSLARRIPEEDLAKDGREAESHVTLKYGLHTEDPEELAAILANEPPVRVRIGKTSIFPSSESGSGDVVKLDVDSPDLHRLNKKVSDALEVTDTHPEYQPHVTVAYVKPGRGQKYIDDASLDGQEVMLDRVAFSAKNGERYEIPLRGSAPFSDPSRGAGDMLETPTVTPQDESPVTKALRGMGLDGPKANATESDRYYHGTGADFARPDASKFDPNGLFGPAYYVSDNPKVTGTGDSARPGYAENRAQALTDEQLQEYTNRVSYYERRLSDPSLSEAARSSIQRDLDASQRSLDQYGTGPNIRPVDVPRDLRLLDADAPSTSDMQRIADALDQRFGAGEGGNFLTNMRMQNAMDMDGESLFNTLKSYVRDVPNARISPEQAPVEVNRLLSQAGYDGIRYAGGKRIPMTDEAGKAIEHNAIAIFPESLDKLTNATAGTKGGLLPGAEEAVSSIARGALSGSGYGAVSGGIAGSEEDNATPESIAKRALEGAVMGAGNGGLRGALPGMSGSGVLARVVRTYGPADDKINQSITPPAAPAGKDAGEMSDEMVRQLFDNAIPLRRVSEAAEKIRGAPLAFKDHAYNLLRLARGSGAAADQALEDHLGPVLKDTSDQEVADLNRYLKAQDIIDKDAVSPMHNFGGANVNDAQQQLKEMAAALGPQGMAALDAKAQQVWQFGHDLLKRKLDAGLIDPSVYTELTTKFSHYSPIRIIDWIDDQMARGASGQGTVNHLSVNANGLKAMTDAGTDRAAETPLDAYVRLAHETYRRSMVNEAASAMVNHLIDLSNDPDWAKLITPASDNAATLIGKQTAPRAPGQVAFHAFVQGEKYDFWLDQKLEQSLNYVAPAMNQNLFTSLALEIPAKILRAGATSANALFMIPNAVGDAMTYMIRAGGVTALPETLPALAKGWKSSLSKDAAYSDLRLAGGGYAGFFGAEANAGTKTINNLRGLHESIKAVVGVVPRFGERVESATRLAEYHRMLAKGATKQEAALAARDVTIDFARGGEFSKWANAFVPFFNARMQAPAQVMRVMQNPATRARAMTGVMTSVVIPTIGLEIYNQQDPTYQDVPQFDKDRGLIMMSPWGPGPVSPETGRPTPHYFVIGLREWSPFAIGVREAVAAATGGKNRDGLEVAKAMLNQVSPLGGGVAGMLPPLLKVGVEQQTNYDTFRDREIVPDSLSRLPNDQQYTSDTSEVAKLAGRLTGQSPMRLQHGLTGLTAGVGRQVIAAGDAALRASGVTPEPGRRVQELQRELAKTGLSPEKRAMLQRELEVEGSKKQQRESAVRNTPILGGLAGTVYREQGGELERRSTKDVDAQLQQLRSKDNPTGKELTRLGMSFPDADNEINGQSLNRYQSVEYRQKALAYREQMAQSMMQSSAYKQANDQEKARLLRNGMTRAAAWASQEVLPGANTAGREFTTVARKDTRVAIDGYLKAVDAQQRINDLKEKRYIGYSGEDAEQIAQDRSYLSRFRDQFGQSQGDTVFRTKYGVRRYAQAKAAKVNPMYRMKVERIERQTPELFTYIRQNATTTDLPQSA